MIDYGVSRGAPSQLPPALVVNPDGRSGFVLLCEHASNRIPEGYGTLGLGACALVAHIAWDPGALGVARALGERLDAPLVHSTVSRLVIDANRAPDAPDLIPAVSETITIPGNEDLPQAERQARLARYHEPFHAAAAALIARRRATGRPTVVVAIHSFTPVYHGVARPFVAGIIHGADAGFSRAVFEALGGAAAGVGWNEPYRAEQGVYHTVGRHADANGLPGTMVEIRNDEILEPSGVARWADRLAEALPRAAAAAGIALTAGSG